MAANFLEQLMSEYLELQGYFVRRNTKVGRRKLGGYDGELDIVAFHPTTRHLVHIEASHDNLSLAKKDEKFKRKFVIGKKYASELFAGMKLPKNIEQYSVLVMYPKGSGRKVGGKPAKHISEVLTEIKNFVAARGDGLVPEQFALLRTIQFVNWYQGSIFGELEDEAA